jgi:hypothetical protein
LSPHHRVALARLMRVDKLAPRRFVEQLGEELAAASTPATEIRRWLGQEVLRGGLRAHDARAFAGRVTNVEAR